jgi:hypothetical protein
LRNHLDAVAGRSYDPRMVVWRCPHCATPQAEAARCWVCHRSTTSCASCRHFRRSVATGFGICGLDPRRTALTGAEMRVCWSAPDALASDATAAAADATTGGRPARRAPRADVPDDGARTPRTFVPVEDLHRAAQPDQGPTPARLTSPPAPPVAAGTSTVARWSLWDDPER